jgi:hypothetical protein
MSNELPTPDAATTAQRLAARLDELQQPYALGGAIALGYWAAPRGTLDVDLTLFLPPDRPSDCVRVLQELGCDVAANEAVQSLREHGFCRVSWHGTRVDVFVPLIDFYEVAKQRRKRVDLGDQSIVIWDAETLSVFKMMFFRRKDLADVEQILRTQGTQLDRVWVRKQLETLYGTRDPRLSQWDEIVRDVGVTS